MACNGSWRSVAAPGSGFLLGVDSPAPDEAWAAGHADDGRMIIDHWDGTSWQIAWTGSPGTLYSIRQIAADDVWAGGRGRDGATAVHWNGSTWTEVPLDIPEVKGSTILIDLAPLGPTDIWGAGVFTGRDAGFRVHWNGTTWSLDPPGVMEGTALRAMRQTPQGTIWAAGETIANGVHSPLVQHWTRQDGWTTVAVSGAPETSTEVHGILPLADNDVWIIGFAQPAPGQAGLTPGPPQTPIAVRLDNQGPHLMTMEAVSGGARPRHAAALSPSDVFAVGDANGTQSLVEHWNGSSWTRMDNPSSQRLFGITSSPASGEVWAVGFGPTILHFCR